MYVDVYHNNNVDVERCDVDEDMDMNVYMDADVDDCVYVDVEVDVERC